MSLLKLSDIMRAPAVEESKPPADDRRPYGRVIPMHGGAPDDAELLRRCEKNAKWSSLLDGNAGHASESEHLYGAGRVLRWAGADESTCARLLEDLFPGSLKKHGSKGIASTVKKLYATPMDKVWEDGPAFEPFKPWAVAKREQDVPSIASIGTVGPDFIENIPPPNWIIEGAIEHGDICSIAGPGAGLKSMLALKLLACKALGRDFLGRPTGSPGHVFYIGAEDKLTSLRRRIHALCIGLGVSPSDFEGRFHYAALVDGTTPRLTGGEDGLAAFLEPYLGDVEWSLIVIDSLARFAQGSPEEKVEHAAHFTEAMKHLTTLRGEPAVIVIHHVSKSVERDGTVDAGSSRGSTALVYNLRGAFVVMPTPLDPSFNGGVPGTHGTIKRQRILEREREICEAMGPEYKHFRLIKFSLPKANEVAYRDPVKDTTLYAVGRVPHVLEGDVLKLYDDAVATVKERHTPKKEEKPRDVRPEGLDAAKTAMLKLLVDGKWCSGNELARSAGLSSQRCKTFVLAVDELRSEGAMEFDASRTAQSGQYRRPAHSEQLDLTAVVDGKE